MCPPLQLGGCRTATIATPRAISHHTVTPTTMGLGMGATSSTEEAGLVMVAMGDRVDREGEEGEVSGDV